MRVCRTTTLHLFSFHRPREPVHGVELFRFSPLLAGKSVGLTTSVHSNIGAERLTQQRTAVVAGKTSKFTHTLDQPGPPLGRPPPGERSGCLFLRRCIAAFGL